MLGLVTMSQCNLYQPLPSSQSALEKAEAPQQGPQCPSHTLLKGPWTCCLSQGTNLHPAVCDSPRTRLSHRISATALSQQLHPAGEVATSLFAGESLSMMMKNIIWTLQESRKKPQSLLELPKKQNFPSTSPSQWGLSLRWQEGTGDSGDSPSQALSLQGKRISTGLSNHRPQLLGSLRYWKHMFTGEKEKKQLKIHTIAVGRRVRETRARLERLHQGTGMGLHSPACTARHPAHPPSEHQTCSLRVKQPEG